jgi:hypothetical protein
LSWRAASIWVAISAILKRIAWKSEIDRLELPALAGVLDRIVERALGQPDRAGRGVGARRLEPEVA